MDPLHHYLSHSGFDSKLLFRIAAGEKYVGIMLQNGHIGVCSTLGNPVSIDELDFDQPDLRNRAHRIAYNAYINALLNYTTDPEDYKDIFQHIDFSSRKEIIMVGFFRPLVRKFQEAKIPLRVFDQKEQDPILTPLNQLEPCLKQSQTVILTSTSIFNGSFAGILAQTGEQSEVYLLGPSSILHADMKKYRNIKKIYGARFKTSDHRILDSIAEGHGTQTFMKFGQKVNI